MLSHKPWLDPTMLGEAKILVEVELDKPFAQKIAAWDNQENYAMIDVEYSWLPSKCEKCGHLGHKAKRCLSISQQKAPAKDQGAVVVNVSASPPIVDAPSLKEIPITHSMDDQVPPTNVINTISKEAVVSATNIVISKVGSSVKSVANEDGLVGSSVQDASTEVEFTPDPSATMFSSSTPTIDMFSSLATVTVLENMCNSPSIICINDSIETLHLEPPQNLSSTSVPKEVSTGTRDDSGNVEPDLGSNKFASLINVDDEEDTLESENELESMDYLTPSGKRILRERPVKPTTKAREMQSQHSSRGRGNRGRGNRGRRG
ncbi:uncharacterized protein LOC108859003 [Raphanus sativus]|nr:uncharacterized protein LOC108859003 [Raphanus sativus]